MGCGCVCWGVGCWGGGGGGGQLSVVYYVLNVLHSKELVYSVYKITTIYLVTTR